MDAERIDKDSIARKIKSKIKEVNGRLRAIDAREKRTEELANAKAAKAAAADAAKESAAKEAAPEVKEPKKKKKKKSDEAAG